MVCRAVARSPAAARTRLLRPDRLAGSPPQARGIFVEGGATRAAKAEAAPENRARRPSLPLPSRARWLRAGRWPLPVPARQGLPSAPAHEDINACFACAARASALASEGAFLFSRDTPRLAPLNVELARPSLAISSSSVYSPRRPVQSAPSLCPSPSAHRPARHLAQSFRFHARSDLVAVAHTCPARRLPRPCP